MVQTDDSGTPTPKQLRIPVALLVGGDAATIALLSEAAVGAQVLVAECAEADVITAAAQMRPLVLVVPEDIYVRDPEELEALARDIRATVLRLGQVDQPDAGVLEAQLSALMIEAEHKRPSWTVD